MIDNGMFNVFKMADPLDPTIKLDSFKSASQFPLTFVASCVNNYKSTTSDDCELDNCEMSAACIKNSISTALLEKVVQKIGAKATGPECLAAPENVICSDGHNAVQKCKDDLKKLNVKNHPAKNINSLCDDIIALRDCFGSTGKFNSSLLCDVCGVFEGGSESCFTDWTKKRHQECTAQVNALEAMHEDMHIGSLADPKDFATHETPCEEAKKEHNDLCDSD